MSRGLAQQVATAIAKGLAPLVRGFLKRQLSAPLPSGPHRSSAKLPFTAQRQPPSPAPLPPPPPPTPSAAANAALVLLGLSASFTLGYFAATQASPASPAPQPASSAASGAALPRPAEPHSLGTDVLQHLRLGLGYTAAYDACTRNPRWVAERLTPASLAVHAARGEEAFQEERALPPARRARLAAYVNSGWDRGHLAAAAAHRSSASELADTFSLANCAPQHPSLNRDLWARLEKWSRELVRPAAGAGAGAAEARPHRTWGAVHVVTGPLYLPSLAQPPSRPASPAPAPASASAPAFAFSHAAIGAPLQWVSVPTHFFKVVLALEGEAEGGGGSSGGAGSAAVAAFLVPNAAMPASTPLAAHVVPLTLLEAVSGLSFFPQALGEEDKAAVDAEASAACTPVKNAAALLLGGRAELLPSAFLRMAALEAPPGKRRERKEHGGSGSIAPATAAPARVRHLCTLTSC